MKKTKILNSELSSVIALMGHTDTIAIGDAGLPVPDTSRRIDLAVKRGLPSFMIPLQILSQTLYLSAICLVNGLE